MAGPLAIAIAGDRYDIDVDYSLGIDDYRSLLGFHDISVDRDIKIENQVGRSQKEESAQRTFALAYGNHLCCRDEWEKAVRERGFFLADCHEILTFALFYKEQNMRQSIAAINALFQIKSLGQHALTITFDYHAGKIGVGLKVMDQKIHPKYAQLVILNEAISPIL